MDQLTEEQRKRIEQIQRWRMLHVRAHSDPYADRSRAFSEIDFLLSLLQPSEVAPNLTDSDKTRFLDRGFTVVENAGRSLRLIKRDDARQAISIEWSDLAALRELITMALGEIGMNQLTEEQHGYWPVIVDRGDGVKGHYCIGRLVKPGEPYWEYWNKGEWGSAGEVFVGREVAEAQLEAVRTGIGYADPLDNDAVDNELHRWQEAIRDKLIDLGAPDWKIDGAGCDSGDPLDFTLAEVGQGCGWFIDKAESAATAMRDACIKETKDLRDKFQQAADTSALPNDLTASRDRAVANALTRLLGKLESLTL